MVSIAVVFGAVFMLAMIAFAVGLTWVSLQGETHTPEALQSEANAEGE